MNELYQTFDFTKKAIFIQGCIKGSCSQVFNRMVAKSIENFHEIPLKKFHFYKAAEPKSAELGDRNLNFCCTGSQEN